MWLRLVSLNKLVFFFFFFQAEDGIRDVAVTGVQTCALFFQAEDGIRDVAVTGVQTCALPILGLRRDGQPQSNILQVSYIGRSPERAARMVNAITDVYIDQHKIGRASCRERV